MPKQQTETETKYSKTSVLYGLLEFNSMKYLFDVSFTLKNNNNFSFLSTNNDEYWNKTLIQVENKCNTFEAKWEIFQKKF